MTYTYLKMGDESYYGLNGLRVDYKDAMVSYELSAEEESDPRAHLMLALCNERLYPASREDIKKYLKKAAKGGDEYAKRWLETGERAEPHASWGIKTADVIVKEPERSPEECCKLAQDYFDAYDNDSENGRRYDAKMNLIKARYYADSAFKAEDAAADLFNPSDLSKKAENLRRRVERLLAMSYMDDEPDEADADLNEEAAAGALRHFGLAGDEADADKDEYDEKEQFAFAEEYIRDGKPEEAFDIFYDMAAVHNSAEGAYELAVAYFNGNGTEKDPVEALRWLDFSVARGLATAAEAIEDFPGEIKAAAAFYLACSHYDGENGMTQDDAEAARWFGMAAGAGDVRAMHMLGVMYTQGRGVKADREKALALFKMGAKRGDKACAENAAFWEAQIESERAQGYLNAGEYEKAAPILQKNAEAGRGNAMMMLGILYIQGEGVPCDRQLARYWLERAAKFPDKEIAEIAAEQLENLDGVEGAEADIKAGEILERAVKLRQSGDYKKEILLLHEVLELTQNPVIKGFAEYEMACLYGNGQGVPKDIEKANDWLHRAAVNGNQNAIERIEEDEFEDEILRGMRNEIR